MARRVLEYNTLIIVFVDVALFGVRFPGCEWTVPEWMARWIGRDKEKVHEQPV